MAKSIKSTSLKSIICLFELDENCNDQPINLNNISSCMDVDINNDIHPVIMSDVIDDLEFELDENCDIMPRI